MRNDEVKRRFYAQIQADIQADPVRKAFHDKCDRKMEKVVKLDRLKVHRLLEPDEGKQEKIQEERVKLMKEILS